MKRLMGVLFFAVVFVFSGAALGEPCPPVDVNLSVADARWLYDWTPVGTQVVTHH